MHIHAGSTIEVIYFKINPQVKYTIDITGYWANITNGHPDNVGLFPGILIRAQLFIIYDGRIMECCGAGGPIVKRNTRKVLVINDAPNAKRRKYSYEDEIIIFCRNNRLSYFFISQSSTCFLRSLGDIGG